MKPILFSLASVLLLAACGREQAPSSETPAPEKSATAAEPYPLDVCLVSGEKLGSMGEPVSLVHNGREIKFCCDSCIPKFKENPEKYLDQLDNPDA